MFQTPYSPLQDLTLQSLYCTFSPMQSAPPVEGAGLLHFLSLLCIPPPQVSVQPAHEVHILHCPSTLLTKVKIRYDSLELLRYKIDQKIKCNFCVITNHIIHKSMHKLVHTKDTMDDLFYICYSYPPGKFQCLLVLLLSLCLCILLIVMIKRLEYYLFKIQSKRILYYKYRNTSLC